MRRDVQNYKKEIIISGIYNDTYEYRHIILPKQIARYLPDKKYKILLQEKEYRRLDVNISLGWQHYMTYKPEPNILLLRRNFEDAKRGMKLENYHPQNTRRVPGSNELLIESIRKSQKQFEQLKSRYYNK
ncbi:regulatory subunit of cyclin-dependent kinase [Halteromyces radiatus]|uniref:regulatory subunit of cyclin-dependent kinase n=1 Tax=Halteromyces radiatus TaxID=101107 RepID=UPI002220FDB2|nr:regulatory subunit of cyclin-dependent kinase [Halteromyces radiatus]KAI8089121.1 regulatory subunit of cyclin-dependent kinase [Halteromyces radiatus]